MNTDSFARKLTSSSVNTSISSISIHPGHLLLLGSLPLCYRAWSLYQTPLDEVLRQQQVYTKASNTTTTTITTSMAAAAAARSTSTLTATATTTCTARPVAATTETTTAAVVTAAATAATSDEDVVRRVIASTIANRALRIATYASVGTFGIALALTLYASGYSTWQSALCALRQWSSNQRERLTDPYFPMSVAQRQHEYRTVANMTEQEELEYVVKTYFPEIVEEEDHRPATGN